MPGTSRPSGSTAVNSYFSAKARPAFRIKRVHMEEFLPTPAAYREVIRARTGIAMIPTVVTPDDETWQDTSDIIDALERRFPDPPLVASTPVHRMAGYLFELYADEFMMLPGLYWRWCFREHRQGAGRLRVVVGEVKAAHRFSDAVRTFTPMIGVTPETAPAIEAHTKELLAALEAHFTEHAWLLGGSPSLADCSLMGPLYGHFYNDAVPAKLLRETAPRTCHWIERMNHPDPETFGPLVTGDAVPPTLRALLALAAGDTVPLVLDNVRAFEEWVDTRPCSPASCRAAWGCTGRPCGASASTGSRCRTRCGWCGGCWMCTAHSVRESAAPSTRRWPGQAGSPCWHTCRAIASSGGPTSCSLRDGSEPQELRMDARSSSSPPISSDTTRSAATAARSPARRWSIASPAKASTTTAPTTRTRCACRRARRCSPASTSAPTAWSPTASPLPADAPSVAALPARKAGYRTALLGKAHFEPGVRPRAAMARTAWAGRADRSVPRLRAHRLGDARARSGAGTTDSGSARASRSTRAFAPLLTAAGGGDTGAPETKNNPIPREWYHTDWVADLTIAWLDSLDGRRRLVLLDELSRSAPPVGPARVGAAPRAVAGPRPSAGPPGLARQDRRGPRAEAGALAGVVRGALAQRRGRADASCRSDADARPDPRGQRQDPRENELIDEACGRVMSRRSPRGWLDDTDVFFTTDHGELQGDFGLLFKGPFHADALMRLPFVWRPAPSAGVTPAVVEDPVGSGRSRAHLLRHRRRRRPGVDAGRRAAHAPGAGARAVLSEWDSQFPGGHAPRSIYRDGFSAPPTRRPRRPAQRARV